MPDHLHLLSPVGTSSPMSRAMSGYARWRAGQGLPAVVWKAHPAPVAIPNLLHLRRTVRYVHLNPCRAGLVGDPLTWLWSTHRDALGLSSRPWLSVRDKARFHAYVSADPTVGVRGTDMPIAHQLRPTLEEVEAAVLSVFRACALDRAARQTFVRTAWSYGQVTAGELARGIGMSRPHVYALVSGVGGLRAKPVDAVHQACVAVVADARFARPGPQALPGTAAWRAFAHQHPED